MEINRDIRFRDEVSPNLEFLLQSYANTQETIQFLDTKVGAYVALIGVLASLLVSGLVQALIDLTERQATLAYILLVVLGALALAFLSQLILVFYQAFQVLSPRHGAALMTTEHAVGLFSANDIRDYLRKHTIEAYVDAVDALTERDLIAELASEAGKLSEIACAKFEHLEKATRHCKWAILLWAVLLIVVSVLRILLPYMS